MTHEPDKNAPATQGDLDTVVGEMTTRFNAVDTQFQDLRGDINRLQRGLESVLNVVTSIDEELREHKTLPVRVERLERSRR